MRQILLMNASSQLSLHNARETAGIVCAPILASIVEKIVDIPVAIIKPRPATVVEAMESIGKRL